MLQSARGDWKAVRCIIWLISPAPADVEAGGCHTRNKQARRRAMSTYESTFGTSAYGGDGGSPRTEPLRREIGGIWAECGHDSEPSGSPASQWKPENWSWLQAGSVA
jgi:hypothetical protein